MIQDLALVLVVAAIVTLLFKRMRQPVVLGYILAGFLVSDKMPYMPSLVNHGNYVAEWAEIGVMFLMFSIGLEFSVKKILKQGSAPIKATAFTVLAMMAAGFGAGKAWGMSNLDSVFLGAMLSISSTAIIYKAFSDMEMLQMKFTNIVMSVLILEDIVGIIMLVVLHTAAGQQTGQESMLTALGYIMLFLVGSYCFCLFFVSRLMSRIRNLITPETLLITTLGLCCFMAYFSTSLGYSPALGAFIIGSVLCEMPEGHRMMMLTEPVKNLFSAVFFVSVGMMVDPNIIIGYWDIILVLVLVILAGQALFGSLGFYLSGENLRPAMRCGFSMAQIGEFSFIIATMGVSMKVIRPELYPVIVAVSVITTFLTPYMIRAAVPAYLFLQKSMPERLFRRIDEHTKEEADEDAGQSPAFLDGAQRAISEMANRFYLQTKIESGSLPKNSQKIMNRDLHFHEYHLPENSYWIGHSLRELELGTKFNIHICAILRSDRRINIPVSSEILLPNDRMQVIGDDEDLSIFGQAISNAVDKTNYMETNEELTLRQVRIGRDSRLCGKNLIELDLRKRQIMVVGKEAGASKLETVRADYRFREGDIIWIVLPETVDENLTP